MIAFLPIIAQLTWEKLNIKLDQYVVFISRKKTIYYAYSYTIGS